MRIFLAGADHDIYSRLLHELKYPHRLCSYYYLSTDSARQTVLDHAAAGGEWIMDSGLFTLMFGADKGKLTTFEHYRDYALRYVEAMHDWGWKHAIVECDVQKVLGVEETFRLREEILDKSGFEVIYVWHIPEGEDGLRKLAATRKRIALSVPELRAVLGNGSYRGGSLVKKALIKLLRICRESGPAQVHLLGCTESELLRLPADTADSTSWEAISRWGNGYVLKDGSLQGVSGYSPKYKAWAKWVQEHPRWRDGFASNTEYLRTRKEDNETQIDYVTKAGVGAATMWLLMEIINGERS